MMKTIFTITSLVALFFSVKAQNIHCGVGVGSGSSYIFENRDEGVNVNYSLPFTSYVNLSYLPANSYFGLKLSFQYLNTGVSGRSWKTGELLDGEVSSLTSILLFEHLNTNKTWQFGYNIGIGYTNENYTANFQQVTSPILRRFSSFTIGGILSVKLTDALNLEFSPSLLWMDPINSLRAPSKWRIAGEDLSLLTQIGIKYRLK